MRTSGCAETGQPSKQGFSCCYTQAWVKSGTALLYNQNDVTSPPSTVRSPARSERFDELIDARGPQAAALTRFPFPTLRLQLCASALEESQDWGNGLNPAADLTVSDQDPSLRHVHLCALPFLLRNRPFVQGLVECAAMARCVSQAIRDASLSKGADYSSPKHLIEMIDRPSVILATGEVLPLAG